MTDLDVVKAALEKAHTEVGEICRRTGPGRWRMSIPARPDRDSDLIISDALAHADGLLAEVKRLREKCEENRRAAKAHQAGEDVLQANISALVAEKEAAEADVKRLTDAAATALNALRNDQRCLALQTLADVLEGGTE